MTEDSRLHLSTRQRKLLLDELKYLIENNECYNTPQFIQAVKTFITYIGRD